MRTVGPGIHDHFPIRPLSGANASSLPLRSFLSPAKTTGFWVVNTGNDPGWGHDHMMPMIRNHAPTPRSCTPVLAFSASQYSGGHPALPMASMSPDRVLQPEGKLILYTRTPEQNQCTIWGKFFPHFAERETRLHEEALSAFENRVREAFDDPSAITARNDHLMVLATRR